MDLNQDEIKIQILDGTHQDGPIDLCLQAFPNQGASTDSVEIHDKIEHLILSKGKEAICLKIFCALCTGYSANPHATIEDIYQDIKDEERNKSRLSIQKYYNLFFKVLCPFAHEATFKAGYANLFLSHLSPSIMTTVYEIMPDWASSTPLDSKSQRKKSSNFSLRRLLPKEASPI